MDTVPIFLYPPFLMKTKTILVALSTFLLVGVSTPSVSAVPVGPLPGAITATTTNLLFYFWGYMEAQAQAEDAMDRLTPEHRLPFRLAASISRDMARTYGRNLMAFSYFWGRADALDFAATLAGEPL